MAARCVMLLGVAVFVDRAEPESCAMRLGHLFCKRGILDSLEVAHDDCRTHLCYIATTPSRLSAAHREMATFSLRVTGG